MICDSDHKVSLAYINAELHCSENWSESIFSPQLEVRGGRIVPVVRIQPEISISSGYDTVLP